MGWTWEERGERGERGEVAVRAVVRVVIRLVALGHLVAAVVLAAVSRGRTLIHLLSKMSLGRCSGAADHAVRVDVASVDSKATTKTKRRNQVEMRPLRRPSTSPRRCWAEHDHSGSKASRSKCAFLRVLPAEQNWLSVAKVE